MDSTNSPQVNAIQKAARDALAIWDGGACNVHGIARALVQANDAARECRDAIDGPPKGSPAYAPARLIQAQLAWLQGQGVGDYDGVEADLAFCRGIVAEVAA